VELREIAEKLGVTHVLEGSVRRAGRRLRVTAQVVEVATDAHLWSETFDRDQADIFAVQDQVARAVVEALRVKLLPGARQPSSGARTASLEAYDQYLLGTQRLARYSPEDSDRGIEALERAVALDPALAPAWASLAAGLAMRYEDVQTPEGREGRRRATEAADRAVTLRPDLAEAYAARSRTRHQFQWDVAGAEQDIARAVALAPSNPTVLVTQCLIQWGRGRQDEAAAACRKAVEVDPLSARAWQYLTLTSEARGDLRQARRENDRTRELASGDWILWTTCELDLAEDDRTGPRDACAAFADPRYAALWRAVIASRRGPPAEAERQYAEFVARYGEGNTYMTAQLAAWTGAKERALELLERAYRARSSEFGKVGVDLSFRCLASDPRFQALVAKVSSPLDQGRSR
jgi:tetratricopeptide (TPR) repeat protein